MERFVRLVAPTGALDFVVKLCVVLLICGLLNHLRDVLTHWPDYGTYWGNFRDSSFTALPMCVLALFLIGHLNKLQRIMHRQATHDVLTGLHNRRWFFDNCPERFGPDDVLLLCDIDHFKRVNDEYGHHIGDVCLKLFADHLSATLPDDVNVARIGGEEFGVVLRGISDAEVERLAVQMTTGILLPIQDGSDRAVTASVGIARSASYPQFSEVFANADEALYMAKERGRAQYCAFPLVATERSVSAMQRAMSQRPVSV